MPFLTVIIPAYNESKSILAGKLNAVNAWISVQPFSTELLIVDDGSTDQTVQLASSEATRVIKIPHSGKAAAILAGILNATGENILIMDMDQATPVSEAYKLLDSIETGSDIAIGSRGFSRPGAPIGRYMLSWGQMVLKSALIGINITDTQCGFKMFRRVVATHVIKHLHLFQPDRITPITGPSVTSGFDVELLFVASRLGYNISEVPVNWSYEDTRRVNFIKDMWRGIVALAMIFLHRCAGRYHGR